MNNKRYDAWFCDCGVIQLMDYQLYDWMQEKPDKRRVVRVCQHCGATRVIWLSDMLSTVQISTIRFSAPLKIMNIISFLIEVLKFL